MIIELINADKLIKNVINDTQNDQSFDLFSR